MADCWIKVLNNTLVAQLLNSNPSYMKPEASFATSAISAQLWRSWVREGTEPNVFPEVKVAYAGNQPHEEGYVHGYETWLWNRRNY